jgi:tetratricopeptide (TPR) repeat protein
MTTRKSKERLRMPTRRQSVSAVAVLLLAVASTAGCNKIKAKQEVKRGNEFFKAGQYQAALASYQEAQRLDPHEKKLSKNVGLAYMAMYQPGSKHPKDLEFASKAMENLKIYLEAYPQDKRAREFLVSMYLATDRYDDAIAFYQERLQQDPKDAKAIQSIAAMYFKKGDFDKGAEWTQKLTALDANNPEPFVMIGVQAWDRSYHYPDIPLEQRTKIVQTGLDALDKALKIKGDNFDALTYINLLYREKAKIETDPAKQQEDIATADRYRQQALELRKKTAGITPTPSEPAK